MQKLLKLKMLDSRDSCGREKIGRGDKQREKCSGIANLESIEEIIIGNVTTKGEE